MVGKKGVPIGARAPPVDRHIKDRRLRPVVDGSQQFGAEIAAFSCEEPRPIAVGPVRPFELFPLLAGDPIAPRTDKHAQSRRRLPRFGGGPSSRPEILSPSTTQKRNGSVVETMTGWPTTIHM